MSSAHAIESNTIGNDARIHQGNIIHNYAIAPRQPCVLIPFLRNEELIRRQDIVSELDRILPLSDDYSTAALYGLGGSGKTQIALDYAYRRCQVPNCSVFWVHADSETTFTQDFKAIAKRLGLSANLVGEDLLMAVRHRIETSHPWVLVLDNADNLRLFGVSHATQDALNPGEHASSLDKFIPRGPRGQVLWTSRDERISGGIVAARRAIKVPKMTPSEAKELFESARNSQGDSDEANYIEELLDELEWLPLAISQAAAYMKRTLTTVEEYILKLRDGKKRWKILKQSQSDRHRRPEVSNSILETWNISMKYLQTENKTAHQILHIHAFLDNQNIPIELIRQAALYVEGSNDMDHIGETHSDDSSSVSDNDDDKVNEAVVRLCDFSFLSVQATENGSRTYKMHKLVQEATRYGLNRKERKKEESYFSLAAFEIISSLFPANQPERWNKHEKYITHTQQACEWATLCGREILASDLLASLAYHLYNYTRWRECEMMAQKVYKLRRTILGDSHTKTVTVLELLARIFQLLGRYKEAEEMLLQILESWQPIHGNRHRRTLRARQILAMAYQNSGRDEEAEKLILETLSLQQETLGKKHGDTLDSMVVLALIHTARGKYEEAEELAMEILISRRQAFGHKSVESIVSLTLLSEIYRRSRRYKEAEGMAMEALTLHRETFGHKHPRIIRSLAKLARTYQEWGKGEKAEELAIEALALTQEIFGEVNTNMIESMDILGRRYHETGRYKKAEEMRAKALKIQREIFGDDHRRTARILADLGATRLAMESTKPSEI
ncbi:hypothetical protein TsFJ059_004260 [Trichoderma semiorbis]|uniref:ORC1/DEAH AAA+ ATPase domain-containing protein n=2 Tax=Trichoderma semiorbis TaxID=1491008 RepID=A0A9P8HKI4_9HYPO|nr:hypothetical protein TsFJ059_004260 [Trichoderma semiorbis]KAH0529527.1 hypothetical protein TsFJ059_004260 [Trichoderma semiorbis]KAH0529528.1 hypothetical protein TsFJ059_004260 [Trichoderma semiorbis]